MEETTNISSINFPQGGGQSEDPDNPMPEKTEVQSILAQPDQEFLDLIESTFNRIDALELGRKEIGDKIKAEKSCLLAKGLNNESFKTVKAFRKLNEEQQENYDLSVQVMRRAIKDPVQLELLDAQIARTH